MELGLSVLGRLCHARIRLLRLCPAEDRQATPKLVDLSCCDIYNQYLWRDALGLDARHYQLARIGRPNWPQTEYAISHARLSIAVQGYDRPGPGPVRSHYITPVTELV